MKDISFAQKSILEQVLTQFQINNNKDFNEDNNFGNNLNKIQFILREKMRKWLFFFLNQVSVFASLKKQWFIEIFCLSVIFCERIVNIKI
jgi:hypothetical protein